MKSDTPAEIFRAEQILQRLDGTAKERPLDDGTPAPKPNDGRGAPRRGGLFGGGPGFTDEQYDAWMAQVEKRMKELEERMRREWDQDGVPGGLGWTPWFGNGGSFTNGLDMFANRRPKTLRVDGGELKETARGAKLVLSDAGPDGTLTSTYEGASLEAILAANPALREKAAVKALLEKKAALAKERETREPGRANPFGLGQGGGQARSVRIQSENGKTTVTITQTGPDGKPETKTYEGADLETIKREHPELGDALGGFQMYVERFDGPAGPGGPRPGVPPFPPLPPTPGLGGTLDDDPDAFLGEAKTGPFGLALGPVGEALRSHLGVEQGYGALVMAVRDGSDAANLGLRAFDVITVVNGTQIRAVDQVATLLRGVGKDDALAMDVLRGGKIVTLKR